MKRVLKTEQSVPASEAPGRGEAGTPFDDLGLTVGTGEPLAHHTWLGVGGKAKYFCEPVDLGALGRLVARCHERGIPLRVLGGGSNNRLEERLRQKEGISYSAGSQLSASSFEPVADLILYAIHAPQNLARLQTALREETERLVRDGITAQ